MNDSTQKFLIACLTVFFMSLMASFGGCAYHTDKARYEGVSTCVKTHTPLDCAHVYGRRN